jgi:hypothetical protein
VKKGVRVMSELTESVVLSEGKYTVILKTGGENFLFYALRHNMPWEAGNVLGNLHLAMFQEIRRLQEKRRPTSVVCGLSPCIYNTAGECRARSINLIIPGYGEFECETYTRKDALEGVEA